jgi:hypothetical protein
MVKLTPFFHRESLPNARGLSATVVVGATAADISITSQMNSWGAWGALFVTRGV